jgi:hypothetical protein
MPSAEIAFSPENADRVYKGLTAGIRSEFKDEPPMQALDLLAGLALAATEVIAKHDALDVRAALLEQIGLWIAAGLARHQELQAQQAQKPN